MLNNLLSWFNERPTAELVWIGVGLFAQAMFSMRFIVQWVATERVRRSIVPETFWYFSVVGGAMLLAYSIWREDPVYILGQGLGLIIYSRNIYFIWTHKRETVGGASDAGMTEGVKTP